VNRRLSADPNANRPTNRKGRANVPELQTADATLHVEVEGSGSPVTVFAHGLTNSCMELAPFTPLAPGTKVRFCFRGHGHSSVTPAGTYRFADLARDLEAVADAYEATCAFGTSMGAGAITHLLGRRPDRFERVVFLLPASLDVPLRDHARFDHVAEVLETLEKDEAVARIMGEAERTGSYDGQPWMREVAMLLWQDANPVGLSRAIREVVRDVAIEDRELLRRVEAPVLLLCQEGDPLHPAELGRVLAELLPNAELLMLGSSEELMTQIPMLIARVSAFLTGQG
jgi:3-oxoadipate enol-lactonase